MAVSSSSGRPVRGLDLLGLIQPETLFSAPARATGSDGELDAATISSIAARRGATEHRPSAAACSVPLRGGPERRRAESRRGGLGPFAAPRGTPRGWLSLRGPLRARCGAFALAATHRSCPVRRTPGRGEASAVGLRIRLVRRSRRQASSAGRPSAARSTAPPRRARGRRARRPPKSLAPPPSEPGKRQAELARRGAERGGEQDRLGVGKLRHRGSPVGRPGPSRRCYHPLSRCALAN